MKRAPVGGPQTNHPAFLTSRVMVFPVRVFTKICMAAVERLVMVVPRGGEKERKIKASFSAKAEKKKKFEVGQALTHHPLSEWPTPKREAVPLRTGFPSLETGKKDHASPHRRTTISKSDFLSKLLKSMMGVVVLVKRRRLVSRGRIIRILRQMLSTPEVGEKEVWRKTTLPTRPPRAASFPSLPD